VSNQFGNLIGLRIEQRRAGHSELSLEVAKQHLNPNHVVHGAVIFALADTGMGAALHPTLAEGELCATVEIKISYFKPVSAGRLICTTEIVNRGKTLANLESRVFLDKTLVAQANGHYAIFTPRKSAR
jgi:acyl-CoA thioesterase